MLPTHYAQAAMSGTCYVWMLFVRYRSLWLMAVAMHIRSEMVLMSTSVLCFSSAVPVAQSLLRESHRLHYHTPTAVTQIEHCRCFVRWLIGIAMQPATSHIILVSDTTSGAMETTWVSGRGAH